MKYDKQCLSCGGTDKFEDMNMVLVKYDSFGVQIWNRIYNEL
ncbi:MAG: hypothetical protein ACTSR5_03205 [Promethearchaeota archaeon]